MFKLETADQDDLHFSVDPHLAQPTFEDLLTERNSARSCSASPEDAQPLHMVDGNIRMEHCINLDLYLAPINNMMESCYTDELETPDTFVSEARNDLNKITNTTTHQKQSDGNPFNFSAAAQPIVLASAKTTNINESKPANNITQNKENNLPLSKDYIQNSKINETMVHSWSEQSVGDDEAVDCGSLLSPNHFDMEDINLNEYDLLLDCQDAIDADDMINNDANVTYREDSSANNANNLMDNNIATHAAPIIAATTINDHHNYALKLNIANLGLFLPQKDVLQTPDIISTILQFENTDVKYHGDYVTVEEIKEELAYSPQSDPSPRPATPETIVQDDESSMQSSSSILTPVPRGKTLRGRRRKLDSDDEDYVPPSKTPRKTTKRRVNIPIKVEESDDDDYIPAKLPKRGRPAKPASARSSESSECSKYREMRDKNNEASRRSRRKRRLQEQSIEEECESLDEKNIRLKAQVDELEKSVAVYRSNLMSLLLKNKS